METKHSNNTCGKCKCCIGYYKAARCLLWQDTVKDPNKDKACKYFDARLIRKVSNVNS